MALDALPEHQWLQRLEGDWTYEMEADAGPDQPPVRDTGSEHTRSLDGVWMLSESTGRTPDGGTSTSLMTLGYDPARERFVGTFVASMMTHLWIYEGRMEGDVLTLDTHGPSYTTEGEMARYRDTIQLLGDDDRVQTSSYQREDGGWQPFLTTRYRRVR